MPESAEDPSSGSVQGPLRAAGPYLTLGLELGFTMIVWTVIGYLLDRWLETLPWLTMVGAAIGMVSVFVQIIRVARRSERAADEDSLDDT